MIMIILPCYAYVYARMYVYVCKGEPDKKIYNHLQSDNL